MKSYQFYLKRGFLLFFIGCFFAFFAHDLAWNPYMYLKDPIYATKEFYLQFFYMFVGLMIAFLAGIMNVGIIIWRIHVNESKKS